jgi:mono/diheme cytochrome c family protein
MKRLVTIFAMSGMAAMALALATYAKPFTDTYKIPKESSLFKAQCSVCHVTPKGGALNPYGKDIANVMKVDRTNKLTAAILKKVEQLDSNKNGKKNIEEIKAGRNPGAKAE